MSRTLKIIILGVLLIPHTIFCMHNPSLDEDYVDYFLNENKGPYLEPIRTEASRLVGKLFAFRTNNIQDHRSTCGDIAYGYFTSDSSKKRGKGTYRIACLVIPRHFGQIVEISLKTDSFCARPLIESEIKLIGEMIKKGEAFIGQNYDKDSLALFNKLTENYQTVSSEETYESRPYEDY